MPPKERGEEMRIFPTIGAQRWFTLPEAADR